MNKKKNQRFGVFGHQSPITKIPKEEDDKK